MKAKCIEKIRDKNNHIIGYTLIGNDKKPIPVKSEKLKEVIRSGQLEVVNLTLTSDNRLLDKKPDTPSKPTTTHSKQNINIESLLNRLKSLGYILNTFNTDCEHKCYIASSPDNTKHVFIIPDDVKYIYKANVTASYVSEKELYSYMSNIKGTLKVIGGKNLISTQCMFEECGAQSLDLRSFDTRKVTNMYAMFMSCAAQSLDLSSFNTSKVTDMAKMFSCCVAQSLDLTSFNTSNVTDMSFMFCGCEAYYIDLSHFDTSNVNDMSNMFSWCEVQSLDLRSFNTRKVTNTGCMFNRCKAQSLDLRSFNTSNVTDMDSMFNRCEVQIKVTDTKLKSQLQKDRGKAL